MVRRDADEQQKPLVVPVSPKVPPSQSYANWLCDAIERLINATIKSPPSTKYLEGVFAPVEKEIGPVADLPVTGHLPECLNGEFVRNGPNPKFAPTFSYHLFDGDGMLHGVRIKDGSASYVNRYVQTSRLTQEEGFGRAKFLKMGDLVGWAGLGKILLQQLRAKLGVLDPTQGNGTGNTALVFHDRQLLALHEGDAPYAIQVLRDGEFETKGRVTYGGRLQHPFTAHPKVDPVTGEMFAFGYQSTPPFVTYRVVSKAGEMGPPVPITLPAPVMMHDFAITENYAVFIDLPLEFNPKEIVQGRLPFLWKPDRAARFGVLPRYAESEAEMRWFELPALFIFHTANAWEEQGEGEEEGTEVVLIASRFDEMNLALEQTDADKAARLYEFRFNLATGRASQRQLTTFGCDFPRINDNYLGRKQRYVYCASFDGITRICGVAKVDLLKPPNLSAPHYTVSGCVTGFFDHGPGRFGSEPVFVPWTTEPGAEEDDGYILSFVHDTNTDVSSVVVLDAKTLSSQPVATITLPQRMPYGFHGIFVSEAEIASQVAE